MKTKPTYSMQPLRVDVAGAMALLSVSRSRLYRHVKSGKIKSVLDGGRRFFLYEELKRFAEGRDE